MMPLRVMKLCGGGEWGVTGGGGRAWGVGMMPVGVPGWDKGWECCRKWRGELGWFKSGSENCVWGCRGFTWGSQGAVGGSGELGWCQSGS